MRDTQHLTRNETEPRELASFSYATVKARRVNHSPTVRGAESHRAAAGPTPTRCARNGRAHTQHTQAPRTHTRTKTTLFPRSSSAQSAQLPDCTSSAHNTCAALFCMKTQSSPPCPAAPPRRTPIHLQRDVQPMTGMHFHSALRAGVHTLRKRFL